MITINVITNNNNWYRFIKNPIKYVEGKIEKINRLCKPYPKKNVYCTLLLSDNKEIRNLNKKFRKKNKATDVLSFPFQSKKDLKKSLKKEKEIYLGDIIINFSKVNNKNLEIFKLQFDQLWVHGLAHLFGHDHKKEKDFYIMSQLEKKYIRLINA